MGQYGTAATPKGRLHIYDGDSGIDPSGNANANDIVVEGSGSGGMSILFPATSRGNIHFGSVDGATDLEDRARVQYHGTAKELRLGSNESGGQVVPKTGQNVTAFTLDDNQNATFSGDVSISGDLAYDVHVTGDLTVDSDVIIGTATATNRPLMNKMEDNAGAYFENSCDTVVAFYFDANRQSPRRW
ncbi:MAG: hypothetical protein ABGY41_16845 [Candidatus Poribacteria bacterium]